MKPGISDQKAYTSENTLQSEHQLQGNAREKALERAGRLRQIPLCSVSASDLEMIAIGAYSPLTGFLNQADYERVVTEMRLANDLVWPIPITLAVDDDLAADVKEGQEIALVRDGHTLAIMEVAEKFRYDKEAEASHVYQTTDPKHPGVARLYQQGDTLLGGDIWLIATPPETRQFPKLLRTPKETREMFAQKKWRKVVGFQTRNPLHIVHEVILHQAVEIADGLLLHPLVGNTKADDIPAAARIESYQIMIDNYLPQERVLLGVFPAAMRYAGPREAVCHALCRKNYGCTHIIIGRDHAGVGNYYHPLAACDIFQTFTYDELGIEPLFAPEIKYHCQKCHQVVTSRDCNHSDDYFQMSGTQVREMLANGQIPPKEIMRPEVSKALIKAISK